MACSRLLPFVRSSLPCAHKPRPIRPERVFRSSNCTLQLTSRSWTQLNIPVCQLRTASTTAAAVASTNTAQDARSSFTRLKNLLLGTTLSLTFIFGLYYTTDTRSSFHEYLVIPCLRYWFADAEDAHEFGNRALKALGRFGLHPRERGDPDAKGDLAVEVFGHRLRNPIGTSAGIDKHCEIPDVLLSAGPAIVEIGGVTPQPQEGNPKPRVWRIKSQNALINRYGLNSEGADYIAMRLRQRLREYAYHMGLGIDEQAEQIILDGEAGVPPGSLQEGKLLAVQIAKNKWTKDEDIESVKKDYVYCTSLLGRYADLIVVNVSSPNTPGLRSLQKTEPLTEILEAVVGAARKVKRKTPVHVMVKVSPDEDSEEDVRGICDAVWDSGVDGVVVGNTTKKRPDPFPGYSISEQEQRYLSEVGGYSGPSTFGRTVALVKRYRKILDESSYIRANSPPSSTTKPPSTQQPLENSERTAKSPSSDSKDEPSIGSSIASSAKSLLLETHNETHPPVTDSEVEASVSRDKQHLKPQTPEAATDSQSQPIIRLPERTNPFSSSSSNAEESSPSLASQTENPTATSSNDDTFLSPSLPPTSSAPPSSSSSSSDPPRRKVIFATGGITSGPQALEILEAGADVAQVYTALVYGGIGTISKMKIEMREELAAKKKEQGAGR
ncbi:MAG: hypothetical protein L6R38_009477 [Xanthoria sp. 2 TBL-2021]|nr:MAG: hypothetical protein L6R38_009477 [Xanthoria sp. 2 TBL-2021]